MYHKVYLAIHVNVFKANTMYKIIAQIYTLIDHVYLLQHTITISNNNIIIIIIIFIFIYILNNNLKYNIYLNNLTFNVTYRINLPSVS